jgi:predicted transcriptional regulator
MKTEINIPDKLFRKVEDAANKLKISRKRLYLKAIKQFVENRKYDSEDITAKLNAFYSRKDISFESTWE